MISLHGLDLSFLKANPLPRKRGRPKSKPVAVNKRADLPCPALMPDIRPFISPVGEKPSLISSRKHLRDHERAYNMHQVGNDLGVGTIAAKNEAKLKARQELAKGIEGDWA